MSSIDARPTAFRIRTRVVLEESDLRAINRALRAIPEKLRRKVARKGMREVMQLGVRTARAHALPADKATRRAVAIKIKTFRNRVVWGAVGVRIGGPFTSGNRFGERYPGWRSHLWDGGFRVWQKGVKADGTTRVPKPGAWKPNPNPKLPVVTRRGWRKGKKPSRHLSPVVIGRRFYLTKAAARVRNMARPAIENAVLDALREINRGN